jgi:hypothetical protein
LRCYVRDGTLQQRPRYTPARGRSSSIDPIVALLATPFRTVPMKLHDPSIASRPPADAGVEPHPTGSRGEATWLAQALDGAQRASVRTEWMAVHTCTAPFPELVHAVHAFVRAWRADRVPPERVLAAIKGVTRSCTFPCIDPSRADRLQALVLREFLVSYYDIAAPAPLPQEGPV